jgi:mono/diheme cytochrome c family protein
MRVKRVALLLAVLALLAYGFFVHWRTHNLGPVERGYRVAYRYGCFTCHGPGGGTGMPDPGHGLGDVPAWSGGIVTMYAESETELREWITDGMPKRIRNDPEQMKARSKATILMPAWGAVINGRDLDDLVAYVKAASDLEIPKEDRAAEGRQVALKYGCFHCHGPQGRGGAPNAHSLKGYIPSWDGDDFPELVRDSGEIREWILDGGTKRLKGNPFARYFMERQLIEMPAYRGQITEQEVDRLSDYILWLKKPPQPSSAR